MEFTDKEIIFNIKNNVNSKEMYNTLWNKYQNMIKKHYFKTIKSIGANISYEDYSQNAFLNMITAVEKINLNRIKDDSWKFQNIYWFYLQKLNWKTRNKYIKEVNTSNNIDNYELLYGIKTEGDNNSYNSIYSSEYNPEENFFKIDKERQYYIFINSLNDRQKKILELRRKNVSIKDIGKLLNRKQSLIYFEIYKMKKLASDIFEITYK